MPCEGYRGAINTDSICLQNTDYEFTTHVSYLEIYNDSGYDLLDPKHEGAKLEDLP